MATLSCGLAGFPVQLYRRPATTDRISIKQGATKHERERERENRIRVIKVHETRDHRPLYRSPRPIYLDHTLDPSGHGFAGSLPLPPCINSLQLHAETTIRSLSLRFDRVISPPHGERLASPIAPRIARRFNLMPLFGKLVN